MALSESLSTLESDLEAGTGTPDGQERIVRLVTEHARERGYDGKLIEKQLQVLLLRPRWVRAACSELRDLREAEPSWLADALDAAETNRILGGLATRWWQHGVVTFAQYLRMVLRIAHRHERTNYDALIRSGCSRRDARWLMSPRC